MGNKKKKKKNSNHAKARLTEEAADELVALEAIYSQDFCIGQPAGSFTLRVVPHPGEVEANRCGITLHITYPPQYPRQSVQLHLQQATGLHGSQVKALASTLQDAAARHASAGEVCVFNLVELCQEVLRAGNDFEQATDDNPAEPSKCSIDDAGSVGLTCVGWPAGSGLFDDAVEDPYWFPSAAPQHHGSATGVPVAAQAPHPRPSVSAFPARSPSLHQPQTNSLGGLPTSSLRLARPATSLGSVLSATVTSLVHSIGGAVTRAVGAVTLPRAVRRMLASTTSSAALSRAATDCAAGSDVEDSQGSSSDGKDQEHKQLRKDLLLGRMVQLVASQAAEGAPALVGKLATTGVLPSWVASCLLNNPQLFDKAFAAAFKEEAVQQGIMPSMEGPSSTADALISRIFQHTVESPSVVLEAQRTASNTLSASSGGAGLSRYQTDFQELRKLGAGGFGVVVAAVNRLDGRQYAVKKIRVDQRQPVAYARILREVATLSRLSSPHVVRYYQAWCEFVSEPSATEVDSETEAWGSGATCSSMDGLTDKGVSVGGRSAKNKAVPARGLPAGPKNTLQPVMEQSLEGVLSPSPSPDPCPLQVANPAAVQPMTPAASNAPAKQHAAASRTSLHAPAAGDWSHTYGESHTYGASNTEASATSDSMSQHIPTRPLLLHEQGLCWGGSADLDERHRLGQVQPTTAVSSGSNDLFGPAEWADGPYSGMVGQMDDFQGSSELLAQKPGSNVLARTEARHTDREPAAAQETLFIQMEYCSRTLREVLDSGPLDTEAGWKVLRQIAQGLAHIHQQGIIHRDLKPANVFFDSKGDVKLGDLGLAKFTENTGADEAGTVGGDEPVDGMVGCAARQPLGEASGVMGTSWYISPEIRDGWAQYDAKVDMYSLGVLAFELWHPFRTGMERVKALELLVHAGELPHQWAAVHQQEACVVRWLLNKNPAERPSARDLLASPLLPPSLGDEALRDVLRSMDEDGETLETVLGHVFSNSLRDGAGSRSVADSIATAGAPDLRTTMDSELCVRQAIAEAWGRHGAIPLRTQQWASNAGPCAGAPDVARAVLPNGQQLCLPYDLRRPLVAWLEQVLQTGPQLLSEVGLRRFQVAPVYRAAVGAGLPRSFLQADVDFIHPAAADTAGGTDRALDPTLLLEAEVVKAVVDILQLLPADLTTFEIRLGHIAITDACLKHIGIPSEVSSSAARLLSSALTPSPKDVAGRNRAWPGVRAGMEGLGLSPAHVARSRQVALHLPGQVTEALGRTGAFMQEWGGPSAWAALEAMETIVDILRDWGVPEDALLLEPLLLPQAEYYCGFAFQMHLIAVPHDAHIGARPCPVFAVGGRYNCSWRLSGAAEREPLARTPLSTLQAVGATVNADRLTAALSTYEERRAAHAGVQNVLPKLPRTSQSDVLVCGKGGVLLLKERLMLLDNLWSVGVKAELAADASAGLTSHWRYASLQCISWLVVLANDQEWRASNSVRLKSVKKGTEVLVGIDDVPSYLLTQLGAQAPVGGLRHMPQRRPEPRDDGDSGQHVDLVSNWGRRRKGRMPP